jgi:two-component system LytT family response regulator
MKALIIDDERLARQELRELLEAYPFIQICGEAENASAALKLVTATQPDLLFLDIQMPGKSGFDFLEALSPPHPHVIFTTAYNEYALQAFEVNALDYLTKPIHPKRLATAIERARERVIVPADQPSSSPAHLPTGPQNWREEDRVFVREQDRCWFVTIKSIRLIESEGNHSRIHFDNDRPLLYRTLASLEEKLPPSLFLRANRSQLVNLSFVESIEPWFSGSLKVKLRDGTEIEFSRRQAQLFREQTSL